MDHADAQALGIPGIIDLDRLPPQADLAFILGQGSGQDLHQGALPGPVLTDQGVNFAAGHGKIHRGQRLDPGK